MAEEGETLSFENHNRKFRNPIIGYWDFETVCLSIVKLIITQDKNFHI